MSWSAIPVRNPCLLLCSICADVKATFNIGLQNQTRLLVMTCSSAEYSAT